jgi:hypothetical protein
VAASINAEDAADEAASVPARARSNSLGNASVRTAMNGNFPRVADVFGIGTHATELSADLDIDDFVTFLRELRSMPEWSDDD